MELNVAHVRPETITVHEIGSALPNTSFWAQAFDQMPAVCPLTKCFFICSKDMKDFGWLPASRQDLQLDKSSGNSFLQHFHFSLLTEDQSMEVEFTSQAFLMPEAGLSSTQERMTEQAIQPFWLESGNIAPADMVFEFATDIPAAPSAQETSFRIVGEQFNPMDTSTEGASLLKSISSETEEKSIVQGGVFPNQQLAANTTAELSWIEPSSSEQVAVGPTEVEATSVLASDIQHADQLAAPPPQGGRAQRVKRKRHRNHHVEMDDLTEVNWNDLLFAAPSGGDLSQVQVESFWAHGDQTRKLFRVGFILKRF